MVCLCFFARPFFKGRAKIFDLCGWNFSVPQTIFCPAPGDALCEAGRESYFFVHIFGGFRKPPKIWAFFCCFPG